MPIPVADLTARAAVLFNTTPGDITGRSRFAVHILPRFAVVVAADASGRSLSATGRALGRDHSTISHALARGNWLYRRDLHFRRGVDALIALANEWEARHQQEPLPAKVAQACRRMAADERRRAA